MKAPIRCSTGNSCRRNLGYAQTYFDGSTIKKTWELTHTTYQLKELVSVAVVRKLYRKRVNVVTSMV